MDQQVLIQFVFHIDNNVVVGCNIHSGAWKLAIYSNHLQYIAFQFRNLNLNPSETHEHQN